MSRSVATRPLMFALAIVGLIGSNVRAQNSAPSDSARLHGTWTMVSGSADGFPLPAEYVTTMKRVFAGSELTVTMGAQLFMKATVSLDPGKSPKTIDYRMTGGPTAGASQVGIYAFSGDTVRFSFGAPNAPRPGDFASAQGDGRTVSVWVRAKN